MVKKKKNSSNNPAVKAFLSSMDMELTIYEHLLNAISDSQKHDWSNDVFATIWLEIEKRYEEGGL